MDKNEFYNLLDNWMNTPEYQEYEELCFETNTLEKQLQNGNRIIELFCKAIDNEYGKQLAKEPEFLKLITGDKY